MNSICNLIVTAALSSSIIACDQPQEETTQELASQPISTQVAGADITFDWDEHDFGTVWDNKPVNCTFPFTNNGTDTLVISRMKAGCGCTTPVADKTVLKPGEKSLIRVQFNPKGKANKQDKKVTIFSNSSLEPEKTVWIRSYVQPIVDVKPKFVNLDEMTMGVPTTRTFTFTPAMADFVVTEMKGTGKHAQFVSGEVIETQEGEPRKIQINISPNMPWGAFHSQLSVTGKGTMPDGTVLTHTFSVFANGRTIGTLKSDDYIVRLGSLVSGGPYEKRIRIYRTDNMPFIVTSATALATSVPGMKVTFMPLPTTENITYEVVVRGSLPSNFVGQVSGELLVQTDVPGEEVLRFRITGVVPKKN